jgi:hypothetical protein
MNVAEGSLEEARYDLRLARDPGYGHNANLADEALEVARMLGSCTRTLRSGATDS